MIETTAFGDLIVPCYRVCELPSIIFEIHGKQIELFGDDYVTEYQGLCYIRVYPFDFMHDGIISSLVGVPFLSAYYAEYNMDKKEILFTRSINPRRCHPEKSCHGKKQNCRKHSM